MIDERNWLFESFISYLKFVSVFALSLSSLDVVACHYTISYRLQSQRLIYLLFFSFFFHFNAVHGICVWSGIFSVECSFALWPSRNRSVIVNCVFCCYSSRNFRAAITIDWFAVWVSLMRRQIKSVGQKQNENGLVWNESPVAMIHWLIVLWC